MERALGKGAPRHAEECLLLFFTYYTNRSNTRTISRRDLALGFRISHPTHHSTMLQPKRVERHDSVYALLLYHVEVTTVSKIAQCGLPTLYLDRYLL